MDAKRLRIDREFAELCWRLTDEETTFLRNSLKGPEGCREPILYWENGDKQPPIVDGHTRYDICQEERITYPTRGMKFPHRNAVIDWIIINQLGRRNVSEVAKSRLRAKLYSQRVAEAREAPGATLSPDPTKRGGGRPNIAKEVAVETGVSERQIHRDTATSCTLDKIGEVAPSVRAAAEHGEVSKRDMETLANAPAPILAAIEAAPPAVRRGAVKEAAKAVREFRPVGGPVCLKELADLERVAGALVRAKSNALSACGGKECGWAFAHHEVIREHLNQIMDAILAWKKESAERLNAA